MDWKIIPGTAPYLLVAAHSVRHERNGVLKAADAYTGLMAEELAKNLGWWAIIAQEIQPDPNWYPEAPFRVALKQLVKEQNIRAVIDLHGRRTEYPNLLEVYTNAHFSSRYASHLSQFITKPFKDDDQLTICEDLERSNIPGCAIEIRRDGRNPGSHIRSEVVALLSGLARNVQNSVN